jgi:hypothetical protein
MEQEHEIIVGEIGLKATLELRIILRIFKGKHYLNCRQYALSPSGEWMPTKAGWTIPIGLLQNLKDLLAQIPAKETL